MTSSCPRKYDSSLFTGKCVANDVRVKRSLWRRITHSYTTDDLKCVAVTIYSNDKFFACHLITISAIAVTITIDDIPLIGT